MYSRKYNILKTESWITADVIEENEILNRSIETYLEDNEKIINIQVVEENGQKRFWIFFLKT